MGGYLGNKGISTANQELVTNPLGWSVFEFYKFSFYNDVDCTVKANGNALPIRAGQGFESSPEDESIKSFIVVDSGVDFSFVGAYR